MTNWVKFEIERNGRKIEKIAYIENGVARKILCSCNGKYPTEKTAKPVFYDGKKLYCKECGREFKVVDTSEMAKARREAEAEERNRKALENLHLFPAWSDWEATGQYYMLSARVDYEVWKKIAPYFTYYTRRSLQESEMESFDFVEGWATRNPKKVEEILINEGLIKPQNSLEKVVERIEKEKEEKRRASEKAKKERLERQAKEKMIKDKLSSFFNDDNVVQLSDAEATHYLGSKGETVFRDNVNRYCVDDGYLVHSRSMGDFFFARKVLLNDEILRFVKKECNNL